MDWIMDYKKKRSPVETALIIIIAVLFVLIAIVSALLILKPFLHDRGGRLAIITFHSLEDKIIKNAFSDFTVGCTCPPEFPVCVCGKKPLGRTHKPKTATKQELEENSRSRSAKLRTIEKL